jgi:peptidoglycan/LPS O-acetylase OafA/YrhL
VSSVESVTDRDSGVDERAKREAAARSSGPGRPRLEVLDGLRFLAAMAVLAYHFTTMDRVWHQRADSIFPHQTAAYGWLGVQLFFLISGFVICMSSWGRGVGRFVVSRVVRLYPAYWLSVVAIAVVLSIWPFVHKFVGWDNTLVNLTMFHEPAKAPAVAEVYWTLWAELRFYLLFALVVWWGLTYKRVVGFCVVWLGAVVAAKAFVPHGTVVHMMLMTDYAPLFTAGVAFYLMYRFRPTMITWAIVGISFVLSVPAVRYRAGLEARIGEVVPTWPAIPLLAVCFVLIGAVALGWLSWIRGRWLVVVGSMTYPLYLLHLDIGGTMLYQWRNSMPPLLLVTLVTAAMILLAWLVHRYVERPIAPLMKSAMLGTSAAVRRRARALLPRSEPPAEPAPEPVGADRS